MTFDDLVRLTGAMPCFDMALLVQAFDDRREATRVQLERTGAGTVGYVESESRPR